VVIGLRRECKEEEGEGGKKKRKGARQLRK
jgi:hypothetical protein